MMDNINEIRQKIKIAREWALEYFNAKDAGDPRLVTDDLEFIQANFVEFPEPDKMRVSPSIMGTPSFIRFEYRLVFRMDGSMAWNGKHPIYGTPIPPLEITIKENIDETTKKH